MFLPKLSSHPILFGLQVIDALEKNVSGDRQTFRANFIQRVLRRVPVIQIAPWIVLQINHINGRLASLPSAPAGTTAEVMDDEAVRKAYLGELV